jgi:hypothetical protein
MLACVTLSAVINPVGFIFRRSDAHIVTGTITVVINSRQSHDRNERANGPEYYKLTFTRKLLTSSNSTLPSQNRNSPTYLSPTAKRPALLHPFLHFGSAGIPHENSL